MGSSSSSQIRSRKWLRRATLLLLALMAMGILVGVTLVLSLRSQAVRGAVLRWVGSAIEESAGIHLGARDFELSLRSGRIDLEELELRAGGPDSPPFLVVPVATTELSWRSLFSDRPQIDSVRLQSPAIDLGAPLPQPAESGGTPSDNLFPSLDIDRFEILEGSVRSGEASDELDEWWDSWQADQLTIVGSLVDGGVKIEIQETRLSFESHRRPRISLDLTAELSAGETGEFAIDGLEIVGDALELRVDGYGRLETGAPIELSLDLQSDLAGLVPDLTTNGRVEASGDVTLTPAPEVTLVGDLRVTGQDFPAELLEPLLATAGREGLRLEGTEVDLEADLKTRVAFEELATDLGNDLVRGEVRLTWRRQDEPLVIASVQTLEPEEAEGAKGITIGVDVRILPGAEGSRTLIGRVHVPGWKDLQDLELQDVQVEVRQNDLGSLAKTLGVTPDALGGFQPAGSLSLTANVDGPAAAPDLDLEGSWRLEDRHLVELFARASSMSNLVFHGELLSDSPGVRRIEGGWIFPGLDGLREGSFENAQLQINLPDLESTLAEAEELLEVFLPDPERRQEVVPVLSPDVTNRLTGGLQADLSFEGPLKSPTIELAATWVPSDSEHLSLEASYDGRSLRVSELKGALRGLVPGDEVLRFAAHGQTMVETPVRDATIALQVFDPIEDIRRLDINARLEGGTLTLDSSAPSVPGRLEASIPLAILLDVLPESEVLANLPLIFDPGSLELEISELGLGRASEIGFHLAGFDAADLEIAGVLDALVSLDPSNPLAAIGTLEIQGLKVVFGDLRIESESDLQVDLGEGHMALQPARLQAIGPRARAPLELTLSADLASAWQPQAGIRELVENLEGYLEGTVDSALLTPFLAGGIASGPVFVAAGVQGSIDDLQAEIRLSGPDASLVLPGRYHSRITAPELQVVVDSSGAELRVGRMRLNRGEVKLSGARGDDEVLRLAAELEGVRYRLDHGLTVVLDGNLDLIWPREGRRQLSGTIDVERGTLRRNLRLEQELIRIFNPSDLAAAGSAFQQSVDLDLSLVTREGVRIKNNLADLRVDWDLIRVRGTLAEPSIAGRIDIDPGGLLTVYGQIARIDQGALIFSGVPGEPPRMDFETTSSAEDPRLRDQWNSVWSTGPDMGPGAGFWDRTDPQAGSSAFQSEELATSLSNYFQNRLLQSFSGAAPRVELTVQPLPLIGETDTTARVTMSYHLTPQISYILSQNPREAEGRTDILNLHNFALAPSLQGQFFRNDQGHHGVTVQQTLEFGGGRQAEDAMPRIRSLDLTAPKEVVRKRTVRRATGLRRGQPVAEGADFDIEIDMLDALARRGYPAAAVDVQIEAAPRNRVNIGITVEPGTRVDFEFSGDPPRRSARRDIITLYQPTGMEESPALESIRRDTVRALRARGFLDPQVEVTPKHEDPGNPASDRIIRVHGEGGRLVDPRNLEFPGLPEDVEGTLVALFSSRLSRVELASGEPVADSLLSQSMQTMGYSEAQILSRELSSDGSDLVVEVDSGPRRHLAAVQIVGADAEEQAELEELLALGPGDPVRSGQISRAALRMEDHLREKGFADAEVRARLEPVASGEDGEVDLFFDVDIGRQHRIGELRTEGLANSSPRWVKRVSKLETGELLTDSGLVLARRRLARTGVFQRIAIRHDEPAEPEATSVLTPIVFELEERPRYRVTYGLRGETSREAGVVVDVGDLNFLGRGQTLGLRLIYATLDRNARLYWSIPRVRQTNKTLEFFLEARREELGSIVGNTREAWAQMTFPWGKRSVHRFYTVYKNSLTEDRSQPEIPGQRVVSPFSGWQVSYDTGERSFFETSTDKITLFVGSDLSFTSESVGSDYSGYGLFGQIKPQIPLVKMGDSALVWVHNYRVGLKEARDNTELPFFDRLFAGGEFSVRGYPTNSLGPHDENGTPLGGEAMFVTNQELRFPIWSLLSGVAFFDAGNVWATLDDVESTLFKSIGVGLRADSPVGPLRFDLAFPLDRLEGDSEYKVYFGLGQTF